jgi:hypothetical protein
MAVGEDEEDMSDPAGAPALVVHAPVFPGLGLNLDVVQIAAKRTYVFTISSLAAAELEADSRVEPIQVAGTRDVFGAKAVGRGGRHGGGA